MTTDEAIERLEQMIEWGDPYEVDADACKVAIKALKQYGVLQEIRQEIETEYNKYRNMSDKWDERANGIGTALEIIDKAQKELEGNDKEWELGKNESNQKYRIIQNETN